MCKVQQSPRLGLRFLEYFSRLSNRIRPLIYTNVHRCLLKEARSPVQSSFMQSIFVSAGGSEDVKKVRVGQADGKAFTPPLITRTKTSDIDSTVLIYKEQL